MGNLGAVVLRLSLVLLTDNAAPLGPDLDPDSDPALAGDIVLIHPESLDPDPVRAGPGRMPQTTVAFRLGLGVRVAIF